jgi:hypothetical protein
MTDTQLVYRLKTALLIRPDEHEDRRHRMSSCLVTARDVMCNLQPNLSIRELSHGLTTHDVITGSPFKERQ